MAHAKKDWKTRIMNWALTRESLTLADGVEYFAEREHWTQIYADGRCYWAWIGPTLPPWSTAEKIARANRKVDPVPIAETLYTSGLRDEIAD